MSLNEPTIIGNPREGEARGSNECSVFTYKVFISIFTQLLNQNLSALFDGLLSQLSDSLKDDKVASDTFENIEDLAQLLYSLSDQERLHDLRTTIAENRAMSNNLSLDNQTGRSVESINLYILRLRLDNLEKLSDPCEEYNELIAILKEITALKSESLKEVGKQTTGLIQTIKRRITLIEAKRAFETDAGILNMRSTTDAILNYDLDTLNALASSFVIYLVCNYLIVRLPKKVNSMRGGLKLARMTNLYAIDDIICALDEVLIKVTVKIDELEATDFIDRVYPEAEYVLNQMLTAANIQAMLRRFDNYRDNAVRASDSGNSLFRHSDMASALKAAMLIIKTPPQQDQMTKQALLHQLLENLESKAKF